MNPWNRSRLTAKLGIEHPIIQGPLGGLSSQRLTAAVSNYGGLGSRGVIAALALGAEAVQIGTAFLDSLVEEVAAIAGPVMQWSADRRQKIPSLP
jgi:NAD(P)H-dependent flavin oxidoreductase YrpB (nitropropane dioxygenase family)